MKIKMGGRKLKDVLKSDDGELIKAKLKEKYPELESSKDVRLDAICGKGKWNERDKDKSGSIEKSKLPTLEDLKEKYTVAELKDLLKEKGLSTSGRETTLAKRLLKSME